jgi:CheY-like chemotaxis protein
VGSLLLIAGLVFPSLALAQEGPVHGFESSPVRDNLAQADWVRRKANEAQEQFRLRITLPRAPLAEHLSDAPAEETKASEVAAAQPPTGISAYGQDLVLGALFCLGGLVVARKLRPDSSDALFASPLAQWAGKPTPAELSASALHDEKVFEAFLVAFKAGPAVKRSNQPQAPSEPSTQPPLEDRQDMSAFFAWAPTHLTETRGIFQKIQRQADDSEGNRLLAQLSVSVRTLKEMAEIPELLTVWQAASLTEGLVNQLLQRGSNITPARFRTVASSLDLLADLCKPGLEKDLATVPAIRFLAVDDELISRSAVGFSLRRAFNQPDLAANSEAALAQVAMIAYDAIFLDVLMPGMDGFALCSKIHESELNQSTPIVFVTSQNDFETRAESNLRGGADLITKPFLTFEVALKAFVVALRARLQKRKSKQPSTPPAVVSVF